jgi:tetratricopeptide (TPR) repeat protein
MSEAKSAKRDQSQEESGQEQRFEKFVSILIASVTIWAAITAFYQTYASTEASKANRRAQEYSIAATQKRVTGSIQFSYDWQGAFQIWRELDLQITAAEQEGDNAAAQRYRTLRDYMTTVSPLLQEPYFDGNWPNSSKYEADLYLVEATRSSEHFAAEAAIGNGWDGIASALVVQITLLAVALALYGLSTTLGSWVRWVFVTVATGLVGLCVLWLLLSLVWPLPELPDKAIDAYAEGVGLAWQAEDEAAIAKFNEALTAAPNYANAFNERAESYYYLGDYEQAVSDYLAAQQNGKDDVNVGWNLGWTYYLMGRFDDAIAVDKHVLDLDSTVVGVQMNLALAYMVKGDFEASQAAYDVALNEAARQVKEARDAGKQPPSSLWFYLDASALDLENLTDQMNNSPRPWTQAPPAETVTVDHDQLQTFAFEQMKRIKEHLVALEYNSTPPAGPTSANVSDFQFAQEVYDDAGNFDRYDIASSFPYGTNEMVILFDYAGFQPGQKEIWKVYVNGEEDTALRVVDNWALEDSGSAAKAISYAFSNVFIFSPGEYTVELFIDNELLKRGTFFVEDQ